jgi:hypothetical protein
MEYIKHDRYEPMEIALKGLGFKIVCIKKYGNKTVIKVARYRQKQKFRRIV